jgi:outer membrane lipoprotein-sorting protein
MKRANAWQSATGLQRLVAALVLLFVLPFAAAAAEPIDIAQLMALLAKTKSGEATFVERREVHVLDRTLMSSGRLSFVAPDRFVRETLKPAQERLAVDGNTLTMARGGRSRTASLDAVPEAGVIVEAMRGTLTGNRATLERLFDATVSGDSAHWSLELVPRELRLRGQVSALRLSGNEGSVREVEVRLADGDRSVMSIEPVVGAPR